MSNRLTFSLASLFLIFALAFAAMPVMAADGGPTVTITPYTGKNNADPAVNHVQTRTDFRLKVTFSHLVTGFEASDVTIQTAASSTSLLADVTTPATALLDAATAAPGGVPATEVTDNKVFVIGFSLDDAAYEKGYLAVRIAENAATGAEAAVNGIGSQPRSYGTSTLPKANNWTVTPMFVKDSLKGDFITADGDTKGNFKDTAEFEVKFTLSGGTGAVPDLSATEGSGQLQLKDEDGEDVPTGEIGVAVAQTGLVATATYTVSGDETAPPVFIGINPNWAAGNTIQVPAAATVTPPAELPTVALSLIGTPDEVAKTFRVRLEFSDVVTLDAANVMVMKEDPTDAMKKVNADVPPVDLTQLGTGKVWVAVVNYEFEMLPLYVTVAETVVKGMTPEDGLKVGEKSTPTPPADETDPVVSASDVPGLQSAAFDLMFTVVEDNLPAMDATPPYGITVMGSPDAETGAYTIGDVSMDADTANGYKVTITPTADVDKDATEITFTVEATDMSGNAGSDTAIAALAERTATPIVPPVTSNPPEAMIDVDDLNQAARTFKVTVTLTPAAKSDGSDGDDITDFDSEYLDIMDTSGDVGITASAERQAANSYIAILKYDDLAVLPLTVKVDQEMLETSNPDHSATVEGPAEPVAPAAPTNVMAAADQTTNIVTLTWMASEGATSYKIAQTGQATANYTDDMSPFMTPALAAGDYSFTVMATNDAGDSLASSPAATATIEMDPVHPSVAMTASELDTAARTFKLDVTFTGADPALTAFNDTMLTATDANMAAVVLTTEDQQFNATAQTYVAILKYNRLAVLPLTVTTADSFMTSDVPKATATVKEPDAPTAPAAPTNVAATADQATNMVTLTWTASEGATSYKIAQTGQATANYTDDMSPFMTPALAPGTYMFTVTATNTAGDSPASAPAEATIDAPPVMVPGPPTNVTAKANQPANTIAINWTAPAEDGGDAITEYTVTKHYMMNGVAATKDFMATASPLVIPPTGDMLPKGVSFTFTVKAMNSAGYGPASDHSEAVMIDVDPVAPGAPTNVTATANQGPDTISLTWTAPADGGAAITEYTIKQSGQAAATHTATASPFTTPKLAAGNYLFTVSATNSAGTGPDSAAVLATVDADVPPPVVGAPGAPGSVTATANQGPDTVSLAWTAPTDTGGAAITRYTIKQSGQATTIYRATASPFTTPKLAAGNYLFTVAAMNSAGTGPDSAAVLATIDAAPVPPTPAPNRPPAFPAGAAINNIHAMAGTPITSQVLPVAIDPDGDRVSYTISPSPPTWLTYRTGVLSGTPPITAAMNATAYRYSASDGEGGLDVLSFVIEVAAAPAVTPAIVLPSGIPTVGDGFAAGTGRVVGTTTLRGSIGANSFGVVLADDLPDLEDFFRQTGTIVLSDGVTTPQEGLGSRTVLISEILWGLDAGEPPHTQDRRQFIELYNTGKTGSVDVTGWTLTFTLHRPAPLNVVDRVTNAGTVVDPGWLMDIGQSGVLTGTTLAGTTPLGGQGVPIDIISAYRNINYNAVQGGGDRLKADHVRSGHQKGSWKASQRITTQVGIKASPGARHVDPLGPLTKSAVSRSPFIINEIGNATDSDNDWIELRNVTDSEQSLKNYQLSVVTSDKKDTQLFNFHDQDYKVPAKGVILIASTDPSTNDLAGGDNVAKGANDEVLEGATHLYVVPTKPKRGFNIPDSGKTLLILRNNHEAKHLGTGNQLVDVVGTLSIQDASRGTALWPLSVWGGPHSNVIDGTGDEYFGAGKVYQRHGGVHSGVGEKHWAVKGYTGVGYDRHAANNPQNGGTPGYDNGAVKHKYSDFSGDITISEIMLETEEIVDGNRVPRATRLPQWIELYNSSMTQAVKIHNWHLEIQNDDTADFKGNLHGTIQLKDITVQPNQTVLIVSSSGLNSGNFPAQRTINVFLDGNYRRILGLQSRGDQMLNPAGFYIELRDHEHRPVDEVGNLGVSRRTGTGRRDNFGEQWELPSLHSPDGHRTSLIRIYDDGEARKGLLPVGGTVGVGKGEAGWFRASDTSFRTVPSLTYFGNHRDFGTPGYRGGGPLPVRLSKFRPQRLDTGEVVIHWTTESELNNAGFNILRTEKRDGVFQQVNTELIKGHGTTSERNTYTWTDTSAKPNVIYYYQIQDVSLDGQVQTLRISRLKGNVSAAGKVTTTWGELKSLQ